MFLRHPAAILVSFLCAFVYSIILNGKKAIKFNIFYMLPTLTFAALINPLFNHEGETVLAYFPNGNPFTLEATIYGGIAALIILTVICWFSCFNAVISSEKLVYLTSFSAPTISLLLSMTLRLVPYFKNKIRDISLAQSAISNKNKKVGALCKIKQGTQILSTAISYALEESVERADSMKSRGFGLGRRSTYSNYSFTVHDIVFIVLCLIFAAYSIIGIYKGAMTANYFPSISFSSLGVYSLTVFTAYFLLCILPVIIHIGEEISWKATQSQI